MVKVCMLKRCSGILNKTTGLMIDGLICSECGSIYPLGQRVIYLGVE